MSLLNRVFYRNRKICKSHVAEGVDQFYSGLTHVIRNRFSFIYLFFIYLFIFFSLLGMWVDNLFLCNIEKIILLLRKELKI